MATVRYDSASSTCATGPQRGLEAIEAHWKEVTGLPSYGIFNCRKVRGRSTPSMHGDGRAVDLGANARDPRHLALADNYCAFLLWAAPRIGMQYLIWNRRQCKPGEAWRAYRGSNPHTDHIHAEQNWHGARNVDIGMLRALWYDFHQGDAPVKPAAPTVHKGRTVAARVRALQEAFNAAGEKLVVDGDFGRKTRSAAGRQMVGWSEHVESVAYAKYGRIAGRAVAARRLRGLKNHPEVVKAVQRLLNERVGRADFTVDGAPGPQTNHGIVVVLGQSDGICGPNGFRKLVS